MTVVDWQLVPVFVVIAVAAVYLGLVVQRSWKASKSGCGGGCGCASKASRTAAENNRPKLISADELTSRLRRPGGS
jgi:hypothetical protein